MRRLVVFLGIVLVALGVGGWWFFLRPTPESVLDEAIGNLVRAKTIGTLQGSAFWDLRDPSGRGYVLDRWVSYAGALDLSDPTRPRMSGTIGMSREASGKDFQTAEAVLTETVFAFRGREVGDAFQTWVDGIAGTSTAGSWVSVDRDLMLEKYGFGGWVSVGKGKDLRAVTRAIDADGWATSLTNELRARADERVRAVFDLEIRLNEPALENAFISLFAAWKLGVPNDREITMIKQAARGASEGQWTVTIDAKTNMIRRLQGRFNLVDETFRESGHVTVDFAFDGWGRPVSVTSPESSIDVSANIRGPERRTFTPAVERPAPAPEPEMPQETPELPEESAS